MMDPCRGNFHGGVSISSTEHITACPRNCYSTCAMKAVVEDGRLTTLDLEPVLRRHNQIALAMARGEAV